MWLLVVYKVFGDVYPHSCAGMLYFTKGDYNESEELNKSALALLEKAFGPENSRYCFQLVLPAVVITMI